MAQSNNTDNLILNAVTAAKTDVKPAVPELDASKAAECLAAGKKMVESMGKIQDEFPGAFDQFVPKETPTVDVAEDAIDKAVGNCLRAR